MTVMVPPSFRIQRRILQARNDNSMDSIKKRIWGKKLWAQSRALPLAQGNIAVNFISEDSHPSEREKVWSEKCSRSVSNTTSWSFCKNLWILPLGGLEHVLAKLLQPRKTLQLLPNNVKQRWEYVISITDKTLQWNPWNWGTMLWETIGSYRTASQSNHRKNIAWLIQNQLRVRDSFRTWSRAEVLWLTLDRFGLSSLLLKFPALEIPLEQSSSLCSITLLMHQQARIPLRKKWLQLLQPWPFLSRSDIKSWYASYWDEQHHYEQS